MPDDPMYHDGMRRLQEVRETRPLADRLEQVTVRAAFTEEDRAFIERCPMFFIATADADGHPDCSYKGGLPGFVRVLDDPTIPGLAGAEDGMAMFGLGGGRSAPSVKPLVVYRLVDEKSKGKGTAPREELVRGVTLEGLIARSLKDIVALGKDVTVYNYHDGGPGFIGVPSSIVTPPLLFSDVDIRRSIGKNKRPPLYPRPSL